ncbi:MAG: hypothetical protein JW864_16605 [Spirochaetes bacterium]|nr:hypothetical protein [Spirochaetota bacterium]
MSKVKLIIIFAVILFLTILIMQNLNTITFKVLAWDVEMSAFAIPVIAILFFVLGYFFAKISGVRRNKE